MSRRIDVDGSDLAVESYQRMSVKGMQSDEKRCGGQRKGLTRGSKVVSLEDEAVTGARAASVSAISKAKLSESCACWAIDAEAECG